MRIAIDATPLTVPIGGIARYTFELAAALAAEFPLDEYFLVSDQPWKAGPAAPNLHAGRQPRNWVTRRWWLAGLPLELARLQASVFHGTDFSVPYLPLVPSVMTLHDLSPWKQPEETSQRVRRRTPYLLRLATMIVTPSESVRREAIDWFHLQPSRVVAVPLAAAAHFHPRADAETDEVLRRLGVSGPYILFVGTAVARKNLALLAAAWNEVRQQYPGLNLVVVGRFGEGSAALEVLNSTDRELLNSGATQGLVSTGPLPDPDVAALMAGAAIFVYPSLYEGFGLPLLEAMQSGAPVVISRDPALMEIAGGAALAVDPDSPAELSRLIVQLMKDPQQRRKLREDGVRRAGQFTWRNTAVKTHDVYVEALRRF